MSEGKNGVIIMYALFFIKLYEQIGRERARETAMAACEIIEDDRFVMSESRFYELPNVAKQVNELHVAAAVLAYLVWIGYVDSELLSSETFHTIYQLYQGRR